MPVSPDTLLRAACESEHTFKPQPKPSVLGIDDWAWRRGPRYDTILVDLERNQPIDLLPDRDPDSVASWLKCHPSIKIVARDRASVYAEGAREGAPNAIQVADRWHLLRNLSDAVVNAVKRCHAVETRVGRAIAGAADLPMPPAGAGEPLIVAASDHDPQDGSRRRSRFDEASRLRAAGTSISRISRLLATDPKTLRRWLRAGALPSWRQPQRGRMMDAHLDYLERRWSAGCRNASLLWRELARVGFRGRYTSVKTWAAQRRKDEPEVDKLYGSVGSFRKRPSSRCATRLLITEGKPADKTDRVFIERLLETSPALASTVAAAKRLAMLLRRKSDEPLAEVLAAASTTMIRPFVVELRKDLTAVEAALTLTWTTSPVEGQISRLKMLKRTMYGRAGFRLLQARVLHAG